MKSKLGAIARVLVSVGILVYLFHGIFRKEVTELATKIAAAPAAPASTVAPALRLTVKEVRFIRAHCIETDGSVSLDGLTWGERSRLIWRVGPRSLWEVFQGVHPLWFILGVACVGVVCVFGIVRWQWILRVQGLDIPFGRAASIFFVGMFFNAFLLGSTGGDLIKAMYVAQETHHKKAEAVATVIVDRVIGLFGLFVIALAMMLVFWHRVYDDVRLRSFTVFTLAVVIGTVAITAATYWKGLADCLPGLRAWLQKLPFYDTLYRLVVACRLYAMHPGVLVKTTLLSFGVHVFVMLSIVCVGIGLRINSAKFLDYFLYLPIINTIASLPITISGFGLREGMYVAMFGRVGVPGATALALSLLGYFVSLFWSLVGAIFYLTHRKDIPTGQELTATD